MFFHCLTSRDYLATRMFKSYMLFCQRCVSEFQFSIQLLSHHSNRPITMVHPTTMVAIVMPNAIHRHIYNNFYVIWILG